MQVHIDVKILRGMAILAAEQDIRTQLNGVWVFAREHDVLVAACDGFLGGYYRALEKPADGQFAVRIPPGALAPFKSSKGLIGLTSEDGKLWRVNDMEGLSTAFVLEGGAFPDLTRVIPTEHSGEGALFDPELLLRFAKARKAFGQRPAANGVLLALNGPRSARVSLAGVPEFVGVAMPLGPTKDVPELCAAPRPAWLDKSMAADNGEDLA